MDLNRFMQKFRPRRNRPVGDLAGFRPRSAGRVLRPLTAADDLLDEMLDRNS